MRINENVLGPIFIFAIEIMLVLLSIWIKLHTFFFDFNWVYYFINFFQLCANSIFA